MALSRKIAYVNLSSGEIRAATVPQSLRTHYLGGRILNDYIMFSHARPGAETLGGDNILVLGAGLLCGSPAPAAAMAVLTTRSPLTGLISHSTHGGLFAPVMRWAGFDHVVVKGKSRKPVFIHLEEGSVEIRDAQDAWGADTADAREAVRNLLGNPEAQVLAIGPAGEKLSMLASAYSDPGHGSHRGGAGAVMGSKNLKAFSASGGIPVAFKDPSRALKTMSLISARATGSSFGRRISSGGAFEPAFDLAEIGMICGGKSPLSDPSRDEIKSRSTGSSACHGCPLACMMTFKDPAAGRKGAAAQGPGLWHLSCFWPFMPEDGADSLLEFSSATARLGVDPVESAMLAAWAARLAEAGIVSGKDLGGKAPAFGDPRGALDAVESAAAMSGPCSILGQGGVKAAEALGRASIELLPHVKGMCLPAANLGPTPALALAAAVGQTGGDLRAAPWVELSGTPEEALEAMVAGRGQSDAGDGLTPDTPSARAALVQWSENCAAVADSLGVCTYATAIHDAALQSFVDWSELLSSCTGLLIGPPKIWEVGQRGIALERMFNLREGMSHKADALNDAAFGEGRKTTRKKKGAKPVEPAEMRALVEAYYRVRSIDARGKPESSALSALGLDKEPTYMI